MLRIYLLAALIAACLLTKAQRIDEFIFYKNYPAALSEIQKGLTMQPTAELYFKQALVYQALNQVLSAEKSLVCSLKLDSTNCKYLTEYADLLNQSGNPYKAVEFYKKATQLQKSDLNLKFKLSQCYLNSEDPVNAYFQAAEIYSIDSTTIAYNKLYAVAAQKIGKPELAIKLFEWILSKNPYDFQSYVSLIPLYMKVKNPVAVVRTADLGLYFIPKNKAIRFWEANSLYALREYEESIPAFEDFLSKGDSVFAVLKNYGIAQYYCGKYHTTIKMLLKCCQLTPDDPIVYFYLGLAYKDQKNYPKSIECLNAAIEFAQPPYMTEMYHYLGQSYSQNREFEKSIEALKKAYEYDHEKTEILLEIATTYEEFNTDKALALNYYTSYLKMAGEKAKNAEYANTRIQQIKEYPASKNRKITSATIK